MEDTASFITSTIGVLDSLELKYAKLPSVPELDMMDQTCSKLLEQPTFVLDKLVPPIAQSKLVTITKAPANLDSNNNLLGQPHPTQVSAGPPPKKPRSWWASITLANPALISASVKLNELDYAKWTKTDIFAASLAPSRLATQDNINKDLFPSTITSPPLVKR